MRVIEDHNPDLSGVLPRTYTSIENSTIASLLRHINSYTKDLEGDAFGLIYEDFLSNFAAGGRPRLGGEFFTPYSIVRLIVEIIEPFHGQGLRPGLRLGRHVRAVRQVRRAPPGSSATEELSVFGQEQKTESHRPARQDEPRAPRPLRRHPPRQQLLRGPPPDATASSTSSWPTRRSTSNGIDKDRLAGDPVPLRAAQGRQRQLPVDPAVPLGPQRHRSGRVRHGELGGDAGHSEKEIRRQARRVGLGRRDGRHRDQLLLHGHTAGDAVVPRPRPRRGTEREDTVLFIDARHIYRQIDRAHRDFTARAHRVPRQHRPPLPGRGRGDRRRQRRHAHRALPRRHLRRRRRPLQGRHRAEIEAQGWSLNPGRYVGTEVEDLDDEVFEEKLAAAHIELRELAERAAVLDAGVDHVLQQLLADLTSD
jgi:type I restriction enzyme M protein